MQNQGTLDPDATTAPRAQGLATGTVVGDRYEIVRLIGEGAMGSVYEARHKILGRQVAIKVLKPEVAHNEGLVARFLQEAKAAAELHHKNIVELNDYGVDGERPYMVMEFLRGEDLGHLLRREGTLSMQRIVAIIDPVLRGLALAHERGVIHRDIKPENIFLVAEDEGDPTPKIVDFGIAKRQEESVQLTSANMALGTPAYMAPEQIMSSRTVTGAADQYAVGVTIFEALTGRNPYDADTLNAFIVAKATQDPEPLDRLRPDLDPRFVAVVVKTLARKPEDRYPTIAALREALAPFRGSTSLRPPSNAPTGSVSERPAPTSGQSSKPAPTPASPADPKHVYDATLTPSNMVVVSVPAPPAHGRSPLLMVLGATFVAAVLGAIGFVTLGPRGASSTPPTTDRTDANNPPPSTHPQQVTFAIAVEPRGARIRLDGEEIGQGSVEVVRPRDGRRHQLQLEAPGYVTLNEVLEANADTRISHRLTRAPGEAPSGTGPNGLPDVPSGGHTVARRTPRGQTPPTQPQTPPAQTQPTQPTQPQTPPTQPTQPTQPTTQPRTPRPHDPAHPTVEVTNPFDEQR